MDYDQKAEKYVSNWIGLLVPEQNAVKNPYFRILRFGWTLIKLAIGFLILIYLAIPLSKNIPENFMPYFIFLFVLISIYELIREIYIIIISIGEISFLDDTIIIVDSRGEQKQIPLSEVKITVSWFDLWIARSYSNLVIVYQGQTYYLNPSQALRKRLRQLPQLPKFQGLFGLK